MEVRVIHIGRDRTLRARGTVKGNVVAYWWGFRHQGKDVEQLSFILVDEGFVINQPVVFPDQQRGWWYCDLVDIQRDEESVTFRDRYVDIIVGPPGHPYRVLDLDEFAEASAVSGLGIEEMRTGLIQVQRFLDRRLNRRHELDSTWPDFPPKELAIFDNEALPKDWTWSFP